MAPYSSWQGGGNNGHRGKSRYPVGMQCAASCGRTTLRPRYPFCTACWKIYKDMDPRPEWVSFLIREYRRERYAYERDRRRTMSLEATLEQREGEEWLNLQCELYGGVWSKGRNGSPGLQEEEDEEACGD